LPTFRQLADEEVTRVNGDRTAAIDALVRRLLDDPMPAVGRTRVGSVLTLLRPDAADDQTVGGAREGDVEEPHMLLEIAFLFLQDDLLEGRATLVLLRPQQGRNAPPLDFHIDR